MPDESLFQLYRHFFQRHTKKPDSLSHAAPPGSSSLLGKAELGMLWKNWIRKKKEQMELLK